MKALLGDISVVTTGQSAPQDKGAFTEEGTPFIRAGSLDGLISGKREEEFELVNDLNARKFRLKLFPKDTVVFAKSGMSATLGRVYRLKMPCYLVSHLAAVIPSNKVNPGYLQRWFEKNPPSRLIENEAYPSIKTSVLEKIEIPLPPLPEQRRIAAILDKADDVRRKRQETIRLTEEFIRSVFLDMFGDPVTNPKGWRVGTLGDYSDMETGFAFKSEQFQQSGVRLCRGANVLPGELEWSDVKYWDESDTKVNQRYVLKEGDVILAMDRPWISNGLKVARVTKADLPSYLVQRVSRLRGINGLTEDYIYHSILHPAFTKHCLPKKTETTIPHISPNDIRSFQLPIPPENLLQHFSDIVNKAKSLFENNLTSDSESIYLFNSLVQRAFRGEL